jgi:hypothetical protein
MVKCYPYSLLRDSKHLCFHLAMKRKKRFPLSRKALRYRNFAKENRQKLVFWNLEISCEDVSADVYFLTEHFPMVVRISVFVCDSWKMSTVQSGWGTDAFILCLCLSTLWQKTSGFSEMQHTKRTLPVTEFSEIYNSKIKSSYLSRNIQLQVTFGLLHLGKSGSLRHSVSMRILNCTEHVPRLFLYTIRFLIKLLKLDNKMCVSTVEG